MRTSPLRATQLPGRSTLWTRTLDRLLPRRRATGRVPIADTSREGGTAPERVPPALGAGVAAAPATMTEVRRLPVARRTWTAPRHLPELLTAPRSDRRPARLAAAR